MRRFITPYRIPFFSVMAGVEEIWLDVLMGFLWNSLIELDGRSLIKRICVESQVMAYPVSILTMMLHNLIMLNNYS